MKKFAVVFESSPFDRKGLFNAVHNRIRHLIDTGECEIDAYCILSWDNAFTRRVRHTPFVEKKSEMVEIDGIRYRMLWYDFSIIDHITVEKLHRRPLLFSRFMKRNAVLLKDYDAVIAHSFTGGLFAREAFSRFGVPYYVTWHGSDVHTHAVRNPLIGADTRLIMEDAKCNFFVSKALMEISGKIASGARKEVLYNGVSPDFNLFPSDERSRLRSRYGLAAEDRVVAFVGSIVAVKNVLQLQPLFHEVRRLYGGPLKFWMVGDGKMRARVEPEMMADDTIDVRFWGDIPSAQMPSVMNCIDVLVLPSLNEGLPLVCAEALKCGVNVVGSDVGGVAEVIGRENVVPLDPDMDFAVRFAGRVVDVLNEPSSAFLQPHFSWKETAKKELQFLIES